MWIYFHYLPLLIKKSSGLSFEQIRNDKSAKKNLSYLKNITETKALAFARVWM